MNLEGSAFCCNLNTPNRLYGYYGLLLTINKKKYQQYKKDGYSVRDTQWGYCLNLKTKAKIGYKPILINKELKKLQIFGEIPDGSKVKIKAEKNEIKHLYGTYKNFRIIEVILLDDMPSLLV